MKKIKVYLQYPWKFPDSPYYKYLIENPPKNIIYLNAQKEKGASPNPKRFKLTQKLKDFLRNTPQRFNITIVNAHKTRSNKKYDLIHCAHCLSKNKNKPWVADLEMLGSLLVSGFENRIWKNKVRKYLNSQNCKKILPWTNFVKDAILKEFPEIESKIEVVYPAVPEKTRVKKSDKRITAIYVARSFKFKGGAFALEVLERLRKKHSINPIVVSIVPPELRKKYPNLKFYNLMPQNKLFDLISQSDIFLYPSQLDTFGFSILEAMSFGIPTVALNTPKTLSMDELIENGKTGFLIDYNHPRGYVERINSEDEGIINELMLACEKLIKNKKLRERMSKECIKTISKGKFSIKKRNGKLKKIYEEVLR